MPFMLWQKLQIACKGTFFLKIHDPPKWKVKKIEGKREKLFLFSRSEKFSLSILEDLGKFWFFANIFSNIVVSFQSRY